MISFRDLSASIKTGKNLGASLKSINVEFPETGLVVLTGPSRGNRELFFAIIAGLLKPDSGELTIDGQLASSLSDADWNQIRSSRIAYFKQDDNLLANTTAAENVEFALKMAGIPVTQHNERIESAFETAGISDCMHKKVRALTREQVARLCVARCLAADYKTILMADPLDRLSREACNDVMALLAKCAKDRLVIIGAQGEQVVQSFGNHVYRLEYGVLSENPAHGSLESSVRSNAAASVGATTLQARELTESGGPGAMEDDYLDGETVTLPCGSSEYDPSALMSSTFKLVMKSDCYAKDSSTGVWESKAYDEDFMKQVVDSSTTLHVVGVMKPKSSMETLGDYQGICIGDELAPYLIDNVGTLSDDCAENIANFGCLDKSAPTSIRFYADSLDAKNNINDELAKYNKQLENEGKSDLKVTYVDMAGDFTDMATSVIKMTSDLLVFLLVIFFIFGIVAIHFSIRSVTFESERQAALLRCLGGGRQHVFAMSMFEALLDGLIFSAIGVVIGISLCGLITSVIRNGTGIELVLYLTWYAALILIVVGLLMAAIGAFGPAMRASKKDLSDYAF